MRNVQVDDNDSAIVYSGTWKQSIVDNHDYGGTHMYTQEAGATATFTFTGVSVSYLSPQWPYSVLTQLSLDGSTPTLVNLTDPAPPVGGSGTETVASGVRWSINGLANSRHTLVVSLGGQATWGEVDGFVYSVPGAGDPGFTASSSSTSSSSSSSSSTTTTMTMTTAKVSTLPLIIGASLGGLAIICILILGLFCIRSQRRRNRMDQGAAWPTSYAIGAEPVGGAGMAQYSGNGVGTGTGAYAPALLGAGVVQRQSHAPGSEPSAGVAPGFNPHEGFMGLQRQSYASSGFDRPAGYGAGSMGTGTGFSPLAQAEYVRSGYVSGIGIGAGSPSAHDSRQSYASSGTPNMSSIQRYPEAEFRQGGAHAPGSSGTPSPGFAGSRGSGVSEVGEKGELELRAWDGGESVQPPPAYEGTGNIGK